jgi:alpha 1,3-glucosidase
MWEESFSGTSDSKPKGPSAIAMDFSFVNTENVYGIPEHADRFSLADTSSGDPYRLYNLDVFEYEVWNPMALYASIPFMIAHNKVRTTGLFWLNAAETWVDVKKDSSGVLSSISNFVGSGQAEPQVETHWISESGTMDVFILLGPKPKDVSRQYGVLTGNTPLPPQFSLAYHQCRWNYNDQEDVKTVANNFDNYDIPMVKNQNFFLGSKLFSTTNYSI